MSNINSFQMDVLDSKEIVILGNEPTTRVQILDKAVCVSHYPFKKAWI